MMQNEQRLLQPSCTFRLGRVFSNALPSNTGAAISSVCAKMSPTMTLESPVANLRQAEQILRCPSLARRIQPVDACENCRRPGSRPAAPTIPPERAARNSPSPGSLPRDFRDECGEWRRGRPDRQRQSPCMYLEQQLRPGRRLQRVPSALQQLALDGRAIGLGRAASEILHMISRPQSHYTEHRCGLVLRAYAAIATKPNR